MKTIKTNTIKLLALFFISSLVFTGCSSDDDNHDDDDHDHEEEVITTVTYTLTSGDDVVVLEYYDLDDDDSVDAVATVSGDLKANTEYVGELTLLNENEDADEAGHIQEEIEAEGEEHEFFYSSTVSDIEITKLDTDEDDNFIGFDTTFSTGNAGAGSLTIILKHEPTKPNDGTSLDAGGSTDIEVTFPIEIINEQM